MQAHFGYILMDHGCCDIIPSKHEQLLISMRSMEGFCFQLKVTESSYVSYFHVRGLEELPLDCGQGFRYVPEGFRKLADPLSNQIYITYFSIPVRLLRSIYSAYKVTQFGQLDPDNLICLI